jgi:hypothetical protein
VEVFITVKPCSRQAIDDLLLRFTRTFGGATAFSRAPAAGLWRSQEGREEADNVVVVETMSEELDAPYWRELQRELEERLDEAEVLIRASKVLVLAPSEPPLGPT